MRIKLLSDLHLEFYDHEDACDFVESVPNQNVDVLVLAGDICLVSNERECKEYMQRFTDRFREVIWVAGNHEFYGTYMDDGIAFMDSLNFSNLHFLERSNIEIDRQRFHGCTLWYDSTAEIHNSRMMNDFHCIKGFFFDDIIRYAHSSQQYLESNVWQGDIVVTHMLPSKKVLGERYVRSALNSFYVHDCEHIIDTQKPKYWLHGHSHEAISKQIGDTQVIRNPKGYPDQNDVNFDLNFVFEV